jgi:hypothetical protein
MSSRLLHLPAAMTSPARNGDVEVPTADPALTPRMTEESARHSREGAPFTFVGEGIEHAVEEAQAPAGDKAVAVNGGTIARQSLDAGGARRLRTTGSGAGSVGVIPDGARGRGTRPCRP